MTSASLWIHGMQHAYNTRYCGPLWYDQGKDKKVWSSQICYNVEKERVGNPYPQKLGCLHMAPMSRTALDVEDSTPSVQPSPTTAPLYDSIKDLRDPETVYNNLGQEFYATEAKYWYNCKLFTQDGSKERQECQDQSFNIAFGIDATTMRLLLHIIQVRRFATCLTLLVA
jgi:hypothetical protein